MPAGDGIRKLPSGMWQASVGGGPGKPRRRKNFERRGDALKWRAKKQAELDHQASGSGENPTVAEAAEGFIAAIQNGYGRSKRRDPYKPSTVRDYTFALERHVLPELGAKRLVQLTRRDVQRFADRLHQQGFSPSRVAGVVMPLRVVCDRAVDDEVIAANPCSGVKLPRVKQKSREPLSKEQVLALIERLPALHDRALWATAFFAGLRCGELQALRWPEVDLAERRIKVIHGWDAKERLLIAPKSDSGIRRVPIMAELLALLSEWRRERPPFGGDGYVFGRTLNEPFAPSTVTERAKQAWPEEELTLHAARHNAISLWIARGFDIKSIQVYAGHSNVSFTLQRYGHLLPTTDEENLAKWEAADRG